jgi:hypothetical protein
MHRWENNIRMVLKNRMHLAQDRDRWQDLVDMVMNLQIP